MADAYYYVLYGTLFFVSILTIFYSRRFKSPAKPTIQKPGFYKQKQQIVTAVDSNFKWDKVEPLKSYPFKNAPYKLTMGIKQLDKQDWLLIEPNYLDQIEEKKAVITNNHKSYPKDKNLTEKTVFLAKDTLEEVKEFYDMVIEYLCTKYPMCFVRQENNMIQNTITGEFIPYSSKDRVTYEEVRDLELILSRTIQEDFIILQKDPTRVHEKDGTEFFFKAGIFAFAAGFNPRDRFNKPLSFVHHPIPGYEQKLKVSMNRFFDRVKSDQFVTRSNFSMQLHGNYFVDDANKGHDTSEVIVPKEMQDLDFEKNVHYRSERQVLTKLPKTGAVVFTIRTYLSPLANVKNEGPEVCERLIGAINGFPEDIAHYKRSKEWGPAVIQYLST